MVIVESCEVLRIDNKETFSDILCVIGIDRSEMSSVLHLPK